MTLTKDMQEKSHDAAELLKHLANPNRLLIVCRLLDGEISVGDIESELGIRQPTLSRELGRLRDGGIIKGRRQSKVVFYSIANEQTTRLISSICNAMLNNSADPAPLRSRTNAPTAKPGFYARPKFTQAKQHKAGGYSQFATVLKPQSPTPTQTGDGS